MCIHSCKFYSKTKETGYVWKIYAVEYPLRYSYEGVQSIQCGVSDLSLAPVLPGSLWIC